MVNTIQLKRGVESNRSGVTPVIGELIYTTDEIKMFIGDGSTAGGILLADSNLMSTIVVDSSNDVGIGTSTPDAKLHVFLGDTTIVPDTDADDVFIENTTDVGITLATGASNKATINFADTGDSDVGYIEYDHSNNTLSFGAGGTVDVVQITSTGLSVGDPTPETLLHVRNGALTGTLNADGDEFLIENNGDTGMTIRHGGSNKGSLLFATGATNNAASLVYDGSAGDFTMGIPSGANVTLTSSTQVSIGTGPSTEIIRCQNGAFGIVDGITAPSTLSGIAFIYVDTADGDLKVKFGDGTIKTIATDT